MPGYRIVIDRRKCAGDSVCVGIAPEVFGLDEEGLAVVIGLEGADPEAILEAEESCPLDAITVIEEGAEERRAA